jgi:hypothetical protein
MAFRTGYRIPGRWPLAVALAVVLIGITGVPGDAAGPWPYAVGGGDVMNPTLTDLTNTDHFAFSALQGPSACRGGFGSLGHGRFDLPLGDVQGPISCVSVAANGKNAVFVVQNLNGSYPASSLRVNVEDNGEPGAVVDRISFELDPMLLPAAQTLCDVTVPPPPTATVVKGNIQVRFEPGGCPPSMQQR